MYSYKTESVAAEMLELSLNYCREKMGRKEVLGLLKNNNLDAIEYFRYCLATQIGSYLGKNSDAVKDVYLYSDTLDEEPTLTLPLMIIVHVEKNTAALESVLEVLQRTLLDEYRKMFSPITDNLAVLLNVCFVDETDLLNRKGLASCIGSLYMSTLRVWNR